MKRAIRAQVFGVALAAASFALASLAPQTAQAQSFYSYPSIINPSILSPGFVMPGGFGYNNFGYNGYGYNSGLSYSTPLFANPTVINPPNTFSGGANTFPYASDAGGFMGNGIYGLYGNSVFYGNNSAIVGPYAPYGVDSGGTTVVVGPNGTVSGVYDSNPANPYASVQDLNAQDTNAATGTNTNVPQAPDTGNTNNNATNSSRATGASSPIQVRSSGRTLLFAFRGNSADLSNVTITLLDANRRPLQSDAINSQNPVARLPHSRGARYYRADLNYLNGKTQTAVYRL